MNITPNVTGTKEKTPLLKDHNPEQRTVSGLQVSESEPETIHQSIMCKSQCRGGWVLWMKPASGALFSQRQRNENTAKSLE